MPSPRETSFQYSRLFGEMERFTVPEVHRASLENSLLQVMALGIPLHRQGAGWSDGFSSSFFYVTLGDHKDLPVIAHESFRLMMNHVVFNLKHHEGCSTPPRNLKKTRGHQQEFCIFHMFTIATCTFIWPRFFHPDFGGGRLAGSAFQTRLALMPWLLHCSGYCSCVRALQWTELGDV